MKVLNLSPYKSAELLVTPQTDHEEWQSVIFSFNKTLHTMKPHPVMADILKEDYSLSTFESNPLLRVDSKVLQVILLLLMLLSLYELVPLPVSLHVCFHLPHVVGYIATLLYIRDLLAFLFSRYFFLR